MLHPMRAVPRGTTLALYILMVPLIPMSTNPSCLLGDLVLSSIVKRVGLCEMEGPKWGSHRHNKAIDVDHKPSDFLCVLMFRQEKNELNPT